MIVLSISLLSTAAADAAPDFMPSRFCCLWDPAVLWPNAISDTLIAVSYYCIPVVLIYFVRRNRNLPLNAVFWMFATFILAGGTTHVLEVWNIWHVNYRLSGAIKAVTAIVSVITAVMLIPLAPSLIEGITERKRTEAALRESEEHFQAMVNGIPQLAWMAAPDGHLFWYNQRWFDYTGATMEQMAGSGWQRVHDAKVLPKVLEAWKTAIAKGTSFEMEFPLRSADGTFGMFLTRVVPLKDADGKVVRWFGTNTDISHRKRAEERQAELGRELARHVEELAVSREALEVQTRMLHLILDSVGEGLVAADLKGRFLIWNNSARKLLGRGPEEITTEQWSSHYGCFELDSITPVPTDRLPLMRAIGGESLQTQIIIRHPDNGAGRFIEFTGRPLKDDVGNLCGGVVAFRDITQTKAHEREIHKLNDELEQRVLERTAQLKAANQELEAFTYSVSHDLRAPLRHIAGFTSLLLEEASSQLDDQAQRYARRIQEGTRKMGQLVDELLGLAQIGRQAVSSRVVDLNAIVEELTALLQPEWEGRALEWRVATLPQLVCDPTLMRQVFQNLLSNALKYSRPREPAVIEVGSSDSSGETAIFVRDNGVGFNMKYSDKLFGVFQRLHRSEDFEGTGVGLAIVHRIIKKHGGRVWAESEIDKGATFYFTLSATTANDNKSSTTTSGNEK